MDFCIVFDDSLPGCVPKFDILSTLIEERNKFQDFDFTVIQTSGKYASEYRLPTDSGVMHVNGMFNSTLLKSTWSNYRLIPNHVKRFIGINTPVLHDNTAFAFNPTLVDRYLSSLVCSALIDKKHLNVLDPCFELIPQGSTHDDIYAILEDWSLFNKYDTIAVTQNATFKNSTVYEGMGILDDIHYITTLSKTSDLYLYFPLAYKDDTVSSTSDVYVLVGPELFASYVKGIAEDLVLTRTLDTAQSMYTHLRTSNHVLFTFAVSRNEIPRFIGATNPLFNIPALLRVLDTIFPVMPLSSYLQSTIAQD